MLKDRSRTRLVLAIEDKADGALAGFVYLNGIDWFARNAEFGILIGDRGSRAGAWPRGARARRRLCLRDAQTSTALSAGRRVQRGGLALSRLRFVEEGVQREQDVHPRPLSRRRAHGTLLQPCLTIAHGAARGDASCAHRNGARAAAATPRRHPIASRRPSAPADRARSRRGHRPFGETGAGSEGKMAPLKGTHPGIELHLIGPLQSNKAREAVALFDAIHTIDSAQDREARAEEMARQGGGLSSSSRSIPARKRRRRASCRRRQRRRCALPRGLSSRSPA